MGTDHTGGTDGEPHETEAVYPPDERTLAVIKRYAAGEISARKAMRLIGGTASEHDVYVWTVGAGLPIPTPPQHVVDAEVARGLALLRRVRAEEAEARERTDRSH